MRKIILITFAFFLIVGLFIGCARNIAIPFNGGANFSECPQGNCTSDISFSADSILALEGGNSAKTILFAGKIFLIGDGFSNIWVGDIEDNTIEFQPEDVDNAPMSKVSFDWESEMLVITYIGSDGNEHKLTATDKGKILEEK